MTFIALAYYKFLGSDRAWTRIQLKADWAGNSIEERRGRNIEAGFYKAFEIGVKTV